MWKMLRGAWKLFRSLSFSLSHSLIFVRSPARNGKAGSSRKMESVGPGSKEMEVRGRKREERERGGGVRGKMMRRRSPLDRIGKRRRSRSVNILRLLLQLLLIYFLSPIILSLSFFFRFSSSICVSFR